MTNLRTVLALAAVLVALTPWTARALSDQPTVSSQDAAVTYLSGFTPTYYGGGGTGNWQFCIGGHSDFAPAVGAPAGTLVNNQWTTTWMSPGAGSYGFYIVKCGDANYNTSNYAGWYNLTVNKANQSEVSSADQTITAIQSFTPIYYGGSGYGNWQFCIGGLSDFAPAVGAPAGTLVNGQWSTSWTPPGAGSYGFYIVKCGDANFNQSNYMGWYNLTVNRANQASVSSTNASINLGQSFTPAFYGGSGDGNWQFCIGGYTDAIPTYNGDGGTRLFSGQWVSSWTPTGAGTYQFWVVKCGDNRYENSQWAGPYSLTVNSNSQSPVYISPTSASISAGEPVEFSAWGGDGNGALVWNNDTSNTGSPKSFSFASVGTYSVSVYRAADGTYEQSAPATAWVTVTDGQPPSVPANLSASSISGSSFILSWSPSSDNVGVTDYEVRRDSSSLGMTGGYTSKTVTGLNYSTTYAMQVRARDAAGNWSGWSSTLNVTTLPPPVAPPVINSSSTANGTVGTAFSYTITASNSPTSYSSTELPPGLTLNSNQITGTPTAAGTTNVTIYATNAGGTGSASLSIVIGAGTQTDTANQNELNIHLPPQS